MFLVLVFAILAVALSRPAAAVPISVDSLLDAPDVLAGNGLCATAAGTCTLRAAIQETNALAGPDRIILTAGTYTLSIAGVGEDAAATGDLDVSDDLEIVGAGVPTTVIDANGLDGVLHALAAASPRGLAVSGVTVRGAAGVGILDAGGALRLTDVAVRDGTADGIRSDDLLGDRVVVEDNSGTGIRGGGMTLTNALVRSNGGDGIRISAPSRIADTTIADNDERGVFNLAQFPFPVTATTCERCLISGSGGRGVENAGTLLLRGTHVTQNRGGGVRAQAGSFVAVIDSTLSDNQGDVGGGIHVGGLAGGAGAQLVNSTVSGNRTTGDGGAIFSQLGLVGGVILDHVTIVDNVADVDGDGIGTVGGVFTDPVPPGTGELVVMKGTILAGNTDDDGARDCRGDIRSEGYNLIGTIAGCTLQGPGTGDRVGVDPGLGPLADHGGATPTHALLPGSVAIDGGEPGACSDVSGDPLATDQRGVARPQGGVCDIGAYELACGNGVVDPGEDCDDGNTTSGDCCSATCGREPGLDVDADGTKTVVRDVVYVARRLFGLGPVPPSFRVSDPGIPPDAEIAARIEASRAVLDVDGSGSLAVVTDLVYAARRLFGLPPVPPSYRLSDPTIPADAVIAARVDALCPRPTPAPAARTAPPR